METEFESSFKKDIRILILVILIINTLTIFTIGIGILQVIFIVIFDILIIIIQSLLKRVDKVVISNDLINIRFKNYLNYSFEKQYQIKKLDFFLKIEPTYDRYKALTLRCKIKNKQLFKLISGVDGWDDKSLSDLYNIVQDKLE